MSGRSIIFHAHIVCGFSVYDSIASPEFLIRHAQWHDQTNQFQDGKREHPVISNNNQKCDQLNDKLVWIAV